MFSPTGESPLILQSGFVKLKSTEISGVSDVVI